MQDIHNILVICGKFVALPDAYRLPFVVNKYLFYKVETSHDTEKQKLRDDKLISVSYENGFYT